MSETWFFSFDEEMFYPAGTARQDAIKEGMLEAKDDDRWHFWIGRVTDSSMYVPTVDAICVIEQAQSDAAEFAPDDEGWLFGVSREQEENLSERLSEVFQTWLKEIGEYPKFGHIVDIEEIRVK